MGALTRVLGERGFSVTAIDSSERRRAIVNERCRDLPNVSILSDVENLDVNKGRFNTILMVGVLEYSPSHYVDLDARAACQQLLETSAALLAPGGKLVLAIENQLGGIYLAGHAEEHVGIPYFGVEDRYTGEGVVTFGRSELSAILHDAGFQYQRWLSCFPDYKFPSCILDDVAALPGGLFSPEAVLRRAQRLNPLNMGDLAFDIGRAWGPLWRNSLLPNMANSFLVEASCVPTSRGSDGDVAWVFPPPGAHGEYGAFDVISVSASALGQSRRLPRMWGEQVDGPQNVTSRYSTRWLHCSHTDRLSDLVRSGAQLAQIRIWFASWRDALADAANSPLEAGSRVASGFYDAIPSNLIVSGSSAEFVDLLSAPAPIDFIEIEWLVYRALLHSVVEVGQNLCMDLLNCRSVDELIHLIAEEMLPPAGSSQMRAIKAAEEDLLCLLGGG